MNTEPLKKILGGPTGHFPVEAEIVGYLANSWSVPTLLSVFAAGWAVILGATNLLVERHNPTLRSRDKAAILWFVLNLLYTSVDASAKAFQALEKQDKAAGIDGYTKKQD
ncbi:MAG: hypothetical protein Q9212_001671 [Teloschistes hypoglaucus]